MKDENPIMYLHKADSLPEQFHECKIISFIDLKLNNAILVCSD